MTEKPDGGPAFPPMPNLNPRDGRAPAYSQGMSLREWLAGQALATMARAYSEATPAKVAERAFAIADAMIAEGKK